LKLKQCMEWGLEMLKRLAGYGVGILVLGTNAPAQRVAIIAAQARRNGEVVREIDDAANGCRWLLERDAEHPGGPGRMVLATTCVLGARSDAAMQLVVPVIRVGDRVILEAHTARMDAQLEAVALAPAAAGSEFTVRLKIGGQVMRAVALERGRARWVEGGAEQ
jgi:hypothetical protein